MKNWEIEAAWNYHNATKHSYESVRASRHYLDWENQPIPFKIYSQLEPIPLPQHLSSSAMPALDAISSGQALAAQETIPSLQTLAELLHLSAGITKRKSYPGGEILFRAAACTGALYHIDLYLVCGDLPGLEAGVYQFSPQDFSLRRLRAGDYRAVLVSASGQEPAIVSAPCVLVCASTFWRNAWKYQARAYRHCYWDSGTILANLLAAAAARTIPAKIVVGFVDGTIGQLLGLDSAREAPLSLVTLGQTATQPVGVLPAIDPLHVATLPLSKKEIAYPAMTAMHEASSLESVAEVVTWRERAKQAQETPKDENGKKRAVPLQSLADHDVFRDNIEHVIQKRGSTREFARDSIAFAELSTMLDRAIRGFHADFLEAAGQSLNQPYLIVNAVDDLTSGAYVYERDKRALALLKEGDFRREAGYLGLGQEIPADCSVNVYFLADLNRALQRFGNRGYRAASLEAAIMAGKLYLAAYALGLGASGLTFFDDDVTEFFSPHAAGKSVMFLIALGKSTQKKGLTVI